MSFIDLPYINNEDGSITKIMYKDSLINKNIEEIYLNSVNYGKTKGWIYHKESNLYLIIVNGRIDLSLINKDSFAKGINGINNIELDYKDRKMIYIEKNTWFKFKGIAKDDSIILVLSDQKHNPAESIKSSPNLFPKFE